MAALETISVVPIKPLNAEAQKSFRENIYYLSRDIESVEFGDNLVVVSLTDGSKVDRDVLQNNIQEMADRTAKSSPSKPFKVTHSHEGDVINKTDPYDHLISVRDIVPTSTGVFVVQGSFLARLKALDSFFRAYALSTNCQEQFLPVTVPVKSLSDCGYLKSFPQHAYFSVPMARDFNTLKSANEVSSGGYVPASDLDNAATMLSPTVCYHCFESLKKLDLNENLKLTAVNQCHRHELKNAKGLSRLQTYTMREIVFYGALDFVTEQRQIILEHAISTFTDWNLKFRVVVAADPFFASGGEVKKAFQILMVSKFEIQAYIPHSDSWLAVGSFNHHQSTLTEPFDILFQNEKAFSGCVGYGYERLLYAIYCQRGHEIDMWPDVLQILPATTGSAL